MKYILFAFLFSSSIAQLSAQDNRSCYQKYAHVFEVRGSNNIDDGLHENVIITIRKGSFADCFIGKVKVVNGNVIPNSIQLSFVDGTFEKFNRSYQDKDQIVITNGISKTMITKDEELVNVMFVDAIKPKKKAFKRAPDPNFDL